MPYLLHELSQYIGLQQVRASHVPNTEHQEQTSIPHSDHSRPEIRATFFLCKSSTTIYLEKTTVLVLNFALASFANTTPAMQACRENISMDSYTDKQPG